MTDNLELNMDAYLPLRDVVFQTLREAILKGDLKPGERLMELQLASKLGVSRTPIREAIRMLEQEGLAVTIPRRGAEVAKMTDEQIQELEQHMIEFEESVKSEDIRRLAQADVKFHDAIYRATDNTKLMNMLSNLREQIYRYRVEYLKDEKAYPTLMQEHRVIVEALKCKDKEKVKSVMKIHVENQAEVVKKMIREQN